MMDELLLPPSLNELLGRDGVVGLCRRAARKVLRPAIQVHRWCFGEGDHSRRPNPPPPARVPGAGMTSLVTSASEIFRREGLTGLFRRGIRKLLGPVIQIDRWYFVDFDLAGPATAPPPARVPLEIRVALPEDFAAHAEDLHRVHLDPAKVEARIARGDVALLGFVEGRFAHVQWFAVASPIDLEEVGVRLFLAPGEAYAYGTETLPEWRGRGIDPAVSFRINEVERARGLVRTIGYVAASNRASLKTMTRLNRRWTKTIWTVRLLGRRRLVFGATHEGWPRLAPLP